MFTARSIKNCNGLLLALAFLVTCAPSSAEVLPGDLITPVNAAKVKELVSPGVYFKVVNGMSMKIALTERIEWPPPYMNATEKYSGQVRLSQDGRSLVGYVAGQPRTQQGSGHPARGGPAPNIFQSRSCMAAAIRFARSERSSSTFH